MRIRRSWWVSLAAVLSFAPAAARAQEITFDVMPALPLEQMPMTLASADLDGDGHLDLIVGTVTGNLVTFFWGDGKTGFQRGENLSMPLPGAFALGDWNGDGKQELAVLTGAGQQEGGIAIYRSGLPRRFTQVSDYQVTDQPMNLAAGDWDGDGRTDVAVLRAGVNLATVLMPDLTGTFSRTGHISVDAGPAAAAAGDLDGDGDLDLAVALSDARALSVLQGDGKGHFTPTGTQPIPGQPFFVTLTDANEDGHPDAVTANIGDDTLSVLLGDGQCGFFAPRHYSAGDSPNSVAVTDLDGDGHVDLVMVHAVDTALHLLRGDGKGHFTDAGQPPGGPAFITSPRAIVSGDWNGDGRPDLAVADTANSRILILANRGPSAPPPPSGG